MRAPRKAFERPERGAGSDANAHEFYSDAERVTSLYAFLHFWTYHPLAGARACRSHSRMISCGFDEDREKTDASEPQEKVFTAIKKRNRIFSPHPASDVAQ